MKRYNGINGFTLAEVLITLGIIGIVAALTIPNVTSHYRKKITETRLAKFYSSINQAIQMSEKDNGPKEFWPPIGNSFETDEDGNVDTSKSLPAAWFNVYLKPYLKYVKYDINKKTGNVMIYFPDGSLCLFAGSSFQFWPEAKNFKDYALDDSGKVKNNYELSGIKYFTFFLNPYENISSNKYHYKKGVEPYKRNWNGTLKMLKEDSSIGCRETVYNERAYCAVLIQMNGWKIPDDYPLKF